MVRHLYLHVPFCAQVCPYCAFYVEVGGASRQAELVTALGQEWRHAQRAFAPDLQTIFFGGGTPSLLSAELFAAFAQSLPRLPADGEFTLEVNPATVTPAKAKAWRAAGVNRISLGAQSFDAGLLKLLGRQHAPEDIALTCALLREHGLDNLNLDLMFALPGQTEVQWEATLHAALACAPRHLSAYALTYEEDTPFFAQLQLGLYARDEAREIAMFERTRTVLAAHGLVDYEVSNFALPGSEAQHNLAYWRGADYLGLGPSAVSTITTTEGSRRWKNLPDTRAYVAACARSAWPEIRTELETLDLATRRKERLMFGLRMREGVARREFHDAEKPLARLHQNGLITLDEAHVRLTPRGQLVADSIAAEFL